MTKKRKKKTKAPLKWPKINSSAFVELKDRNPIAYRYLLWLRRAQLIHREDARYKIIDGMVLKYHRPLYNLMYTPQEMDIIRTAERLLKKRKAATKRRPKSGHSDE